MMSLTAISPASSECAELIEQGGVRAVAPKAGLQRDAEAAQERRPAVAGFGVAEDASIRRQRLEQAIAEAIPQALREPMRWGVDDCALWCASVLYDVLGYDPAQRFRGRYTTPRGYLRVLRREGFHALDQAVAEVASERGWRRIYPSQTQTGDIGIVEVPPKATEPKATKSPIQICVLKRGSLWVGRRNYGVGYVSAGDVQSAWRVVPGDREK